MDKNLDCKGRWRNKTVAFRVSEEEAKLIDTQVAGLYRKTVAMPGCGGAGQSESV